jgi:protease I
MRNIVFLLDNEGVERVELERPWDAVEHLGATPVLVAPRAGTVQTFDHLDKATTTHATLAVADLAVADIDGLVLPGGVANADQLRTVPAAVGVVRACLDAGTPVAAICHAPWMLVEADRVRGRTLTSWPSLRTDIVNAGGNWVDEEVVVDESGPGVLITSRKPDDLPAFCDALATRFQLVASGS